MVICGWIKYRFMRSGEHTEIIHKKHRSLVVHYHLVLLEVTCFLVVADLHLELIFCQEFRVSWYVVLWS